MSPKSNSTTTRYLPQVVLATAWVAVLPVVVAWVLLGEGAISSSWVALGLAIALSLAASAVGSAYWKRRSGHGDLLFSELLPWGWLHRYRAERRIANAADLLGLGNPAPGSGQTEASTQEKAQILSQMAAALDAQDPYTDGHSRRVALHAAMIARKMRLGTEEIAKVRTAAAVHDIGKLRTPPEILHKPGRLTVFEFAAVKRHAADGAEIVSVMGDPEITATVRHHHERYDGHGYPDGLVGRQTPVAARIIAVADTFDALTSVRPYRSAIPHKKALATIVDVSGTQLDPMAVRAFLKCYSGRLWVVFWTMLAASPRRAFSVLTGTRPGLLSLPSAVTAAGPAAVTAVVAAAVANPGGVGVIHHGLELAQRQPAQGLAGSGGSSGSSDPRIGVHRRTSARAPTSSDPPLATEALMKIPLARRAALDVSTARRRSLAIRRRPTAGPGAGVAPEGGGATGGTPTGGGSRTSAGAIGKGRGGAHPGVGGVSPGSPGRPPATTPGRPVGGAPVAPGNQGTTPSPPVSSSPPPGGPSGGAQGQTGPGGPGCQGGGHGGGGPAGNGGGGSPGNGGDASDGGNGPGGGGPGPGCGSGHGSGGPGSGGGDGSSSGGPGGGTSGGGPGGGTSGGGPGGGTPGGGPGGGSDHGSGPGGGPGGDSGGGHGSGGGD